MKLFSCIIFLVTYQFVYCSYWSAQNIKELAVIIVPIADATTSPLRLLDISKSAHELYNNLPFAPEIGTNACPRLHQFIFNEVLKINRCLGMEVQCQIPNLFYCDDNGKCHHTFWVHKNNLCLLTDLQDNLTAIPAPYCSDKVTRCSHKLVVTLVWPWYDAITKRKYSVGTRFVHLPDLDTALSYAIALLDGKSLQKKISFIPRDFAITKYPICEQESRKSIISLMKKWINQGAVAYVWGGCSFINYCDSDSFSLSSGNYYGEKIAFWDRPAIIERPCSGFECSSLIVRVAQIYGMPYFFKNTAALSRYLKPLGAKEKLQIADLIWYPGHVLIVSDIKNNEVIEAVGYLLGYGKLHAIKISKVFAGIETYDDLIKAYLEKKPLIRLTSEGSIARIINHFKIFVLNNSFAQC